MSYSVSDSRIASVVESAHNEYRRHGRLEDWNELSLLANDPKCQQHERCAELLDEINAKWAKAAKKAKEALGPFDPRTEVSADARRIVLNMWLVGVGIPVAAGILYVMVAR